MFRPPEFLAAHFDGLVFLIFLIITGILRALASKAQKANKREKEADTPRIQPTFQSSSTEQSDQERIRRFLEALGQPPSSTPPPPVKPRPVVTYQPPQPERSRTVRPRRNILNPVPPLTTVPPALPRKIQMPGRMTNLPEAEAPKPFTPVIPPAEQYSVQETTAAPIAPPPPLTTAADAYAAVTKPARTTAATPGGSNVIANLLRSPDTLRQAILLREILGPPRALSPLEIG